MVYLSLRLVQYWFKCYVRHLTATISAAPSMNHFHFLVLYCLLYCYLYYINTLYCLMYIHINRYTAGPFPHCPYFYLVLSLIIIVLLSFLFHIYILFTNYFCRGASQQKEFHTSELLQSENKHVESY